MGAFLTLFQSCSSVGQDEPDNLHISVENITCCTCPSYDEVITKPRRAPKKGLLQPLQSRSLRRSQGSANSCSQNEKTCEAGEGSGSFTKRCEGVAFSTENVHSTEDLEKNIQLKK